MRIIAGILLLLFAGFAQAGTQGDISGDGLVGIEEAIYALQVAAGIEVQPGIILDSDYDGVVDCCDECPGFDDSLDIDSDGIPDGCDPDLVSITGALFSESGNPITGGHVEFFSEGEGLCNQNTYVGAAEINDNGYFAMSDLPAGIYFLYSRTYGFNVDEWWNDSGGTNDCDFAQGVQVIGGAVSSPHFFHLSDGGTISGTVYDDAGVPFSESTGSVSAFTGDPCGVIEDVRGITIRPDGTYTISALLPGIYYILWGPNSQIPNYQVEWYSGNQNSSPNCSDAMPVNVVAGSNTSSIDFYVDKLQL